MVKTVKSIKKKNRFVFDTLLKINRFVKWLNLYVPFSTSNLQFSRCLQYVKNGRIFCGQKVSYIIQTLKKNNAYRFKVFYFLKYKLSILYLLIFLFIFIF